MGNFSILFYLKNFTFSTLEQIIMMNEILLCTHIYLHNVYSRICVLNRRIFHFILSSSLYWCRDIAKKLFTLLVSTLTELEKCTIDQIMSESVLFY